MVVAFCGKKRSGKDTCAWHLINKHNFKPSRKLAAPIKDIGKLMFGWTTNMVEGIDYDREQVIPELGLSVRQFLQECGSLFKYDLSEKLPEYGKVMGPQVWAKLLVKWLKEQKDTDFVLSDMRFPEEAEVLREAFPDMLIIKVVSERSPKDTHISETQVDYIPANIVLHNDGTIEELCAALDKALEEVNEH